MFTTLYFLAKQTFKCESIQHRLIFTSTRPLRQEVITCPTEHSEGEVSWENAKDDVDMPGPTPIPIFGNTLRFTPVIGEYPLTNIGKVWRQLNEKYGDMVKVEKIISMSDMIYVFDPKIVEQVYKIENYMPKRFISNTILHYRMKYRKDVFEKAMGVGMTNGEMWYKERIKLNPVMMQPRVVKQYVRGVEDIAIDFVSRVRRIRKPNLKISGDFLKETNKWSLESITYIALDTRLNCLSDNQKSTTSTDLINATEDIFRLLFELEFKPSLWKYIKTPDFYKLMKALDVQFTISKEFVDIAMRKIEEKRKNGTLGNKEPSVLEKLIEIDPNLAIVMALDMMLAGIDTTSNALLNLLYYLSINKSAQDKLRNEIYTLLPDKDSRLTEKNLDQLPFLKACVKESYRMLPISPGGLRILTKDAVIGGYRLKKGTVLMFPMMVVSRQEKHFPRPDEFIPERWLRENYDSDLSHKNSHPFCVVPFGFGARACIGRRFAELELEVALVQLIKNFNVSWDGPPPKMVTMSFNYLLDFNFVFEDYIRSANR